jgi:Raf kinase inhibitor-like YbhB/YbcL family protein
MQLISTAFDFNEPMPRRYSGQGKDISPPLQWSDLPRDCQSLALICEDPDAADKPDRDYPITHWMIYNISPSIRSLAENLGHDELVSLLRISQARNSLDEIGYSGPRPPENDQPHRYVFTLIALDIDRLAPPGVRHNLVRECMQGHILQTAKLIGTYEYDQPEIKSFLQRPLSL